MVSQMTASSIGAGVQPGAYYGVPDETDDFFRGSVSASHGGTVDLRTLPLIFLLKHRPLWKRGAVD